jgi:phosphoadenosine phosphosulfate reductase
MEALRKLPEAAVMSGIDQTKEKARLLDAKYGHLPPQEIIAVSVKELFPGNIGSVSSFGADSAVLLHLICDSDPFPGDRQAF